MPTTPEFQFTPGTSAVEKNFNKFANTEINQRGAGNTQKTLELITAAGTEAAAVGAWDSTTMASAATNFYEASREIDERYNPQLYAQHSVDSMRASAILLSPGTSLASFEAEVVKKGTRSLDASDPEAVKKEGRSILADEHVKAMGDPLKIDPDTYIAANKVTGVGDLRINPEMEAMMKTKAEERRAAKVNEITTKFNEGKMTLAEVNIIIGTAGINAKTKEELKKLIAPKLTEEATKTLATAEGGNVLGRTPDQIAARLKTQSAYTSAAPEVKAAIDAQLELKKTQRENAAKDQPLDEQLARLSKRENQIKYFKELSKEWSKRLGLVLKGGALFALLFSIGGPALLAGGALPMSVACNLGLLAGSGLAVGGILGAVQGRFTGDILKAQQEKIKAQKAINAGAGAEQVAQAAGKKRNAEEKIAAVKEFAVFYAKSRGFNEEATAKFVMEGANLDSVEALMKAIA